MDGCTIRARWALGGMNEMAALAERPWRVAAGGNHWMRVADQDLLSVRDSQRSKAYRAEEIVRGAGGKWTQFTARSQVLNYIQHLVDSEWYQVRWPNRLKFEVRFTCRRHAMACTHGQFVSFSDDILVKHGGFIVCHELAHILAPWHKHGPKWAWTYLELVEFMEGKEMRARLKQAFDACRVYYTPAMERK